ncbi:hypothetical protein GpartN1_g1142.t1 [Galdieria partita]|uniref:Cytochrome b5 heme-binding domain-containing protein n=1 Tax=Galdieria partita TaxID=83374 RepID=A0A9C7PRZ8_9RHOD|nr:hypothetical protein GpartN1_g1142.t1 [Galdieria partita]
MSSLQGQSEVSLKSRTVLPELPPEPQKASEDLEYDKDRGVVFEKVKKSKYMTDQELKLLPWPKRVNWLSSAIIFTPLICLCLGIPFVKLRWQTAVLFAVQYYLTGLGITGGYHRLWAHRSYRATWPVELVLALWGAAAFEGSARWWARNHRAHHRYVDSDKDPYAVHKGFWYAHLGWMVLKQDVRRAGRVDISDLNANKLLRFQHKYYLPIALTFGFIFPTAVAHFGWGDAWGALIYACFGRMFFVHQATFFINSMAHTFGSQTYSTEHSSYDSIVTALFSFGEGYHNYHHEFPHDYRNGVMWYHFDPTKWTLRFLSWFGLVKRLVRFSKNEVKKAKLQVEQQNLEKQMKQLDWGKPIESLPEMTWKDIETQVEKGLYLVVIDGLVYNVTDFLPSHPGGRKILEFWNGRDASRAFNGEVYRHSKAARNLMAHIRYAKLVEKLQ